MVLRIAHRGASGVCPENTLTAFRRALAMGVDGIELDVHRTRDGHLVVIHDPILDRTTSGSGLVMNHTLDEIRRLDAGAWKGPEFAGERVPTLQEVLREIPPSVRIFVELKAGSTHYPGIEEQLLRVLREERVADRTQISSFDHHALYRLHQLDPDMPLGILFLSNPLDPVARAREVGAEALHPVFFWATRPLVEQARRAGLRVVAWPVNDPTFIAMVKQAGVDGIISDFPDRI